MLSISGFAVVIQMFGFVHRIYLDFIYVQLTVRTLDILSSWMIESLPEGRIPLLNHLTFLCVCSRPATFQTFQAAPLTLLGVFPP